jgi:FMN phosphatase YigB (HAD superfamily)
MKIVVWDIDDVLNDLMQEWFSFYVVHTGKSQTIAYEDLKENPPNRLLNISKTEYLKSLDEFRAAYGKEMKPLPDIMRWFEKRGDLYSHFALTATPCFYAGTSAEWLFRNFGRWFSSFNYIPSKREGDEQTHQYLSKGSFLSTYTSIDAFIDDNPKNVQEASALGIKTFLFPRPWNTSAYHSSDDLFGDLEKHLR